MLVARAADKALRMLMPKVEAGACVPDHGQACASTLCQVRTITCESGRVTRYYYQYRIACAGTCYWSNYCSKQHTTQPC